MTLEADDISRPDSGLVIEAADPETIAITEIRRDSELNCRHAGVSKATAASYSEVMKAKGAEAFPAIVIFTDSKGVHWLADGFHRCAAAELAGIERLRFERHSGSRRDALLFAAGANAEHGRARSPSDKLKSVRAILSDPTWAKRADNWIAKHAKVSHTYVAKIRSTCHDSSGGVRETSDGRVMDTSGIGKPAASDEQIATKLAVQMERLIAQWPDTRHDALRALLTRWSDALGAPPAAAE
jgi:hypothetical protein